MKKILIFITFISLAMLLTACGGKTTDPTTYNVSFETDGGTVIATQKITEGGLVEKPSDPNKNDYVFDGKWVNGTTAWNFDIDIVTEDITLTAQWIFISSTPTNVVMTDDIFSSTVTWTQTDAALQTFTVSVKAAGANEFTVIDGQVSVSAGAVLDVVTFTPNETLGGYYLVKVDTGSEESTSELLLFGGAGTESNPHLTSKVADINAILDNESLANKHFLQVTDIIMTLEDAIEINDSRKVVFSGVYNGGNYSLSFVGNGGLFHEITENGVVKNLVIDDTTQISASEINLYSIGVIADINNGLIENVSTRGKVVNTKLQGELPVYDGTVDTSDLTTGAGAIVGVNGATGIIRNVEVAGSGLVKAGRGIGGVSAYNFGLISRAKVTATLGAGNQSNSGKSSNSYSFAGGITGFNFGTIEESVVSGRVFAQSAYPTAADGNEGKNVVVGGIAGYNEGIITETSFARNLDMKEFIDKTKAEELEDSANNLGVASIHGDLYVGGIVGINAGDINNVYVGGALVGGRDFVGGITGLTVGNGNITNSYVFAEIAIKDESGIKITTVSDKTTLTTYEIAPSGFDSATVFYKLLVNSVTDNTWKPGDDEKPKLPVFEAADLAMVGDKFSETGLLLWQTGIVTSVDITLDNVVVSHGATIDVEFMVNPSNAPDTFTLWTSSDDAIVEIVGEGQIKGVGAGTATITVTTRDGAFTDIINVTVEDYIKIDSYTVTADEITLPVPNDSDARQEINIGSTVSINVTEILPIDAEYQNFTVTTSNSRATVEGNVVTIVYGNTGPGSVSIYVSFEDSSISELNYRFTTVEPLVDIPVESVVVTANEITLPTANDSDDRQEITIGDTVTINVLDILPDDATNKSYTVTTSNSRATAEGNVVTIVYGNTGPGSVSIYVTFADPAIGELNYRFTTVEAVPLESVVVTATEITLPVPNDSAVRQDILIGSTVTINVTDFLPANATNQNYTVTTSNSRAVAVGNVVTMVYGNTGPGKVSIYVTFEDEAIGELNYRFTTIGTVGIALESAVVTAEEITLPAANDSEDRQEILIGSTITINVTDVLPIDTSNRNYTVTTSNSRATVEGDVVTIVYGDTGPGNVSVYVTFEDAAIGELNYRFTTVDAPAAIPVESVVVTATEITLPTANDADIRQEITIGSTVTINVSDILPVDASNQNYTITTSNSRATVEGNVVTIVYGNTGPGSVSIYVTFEDAAIGELNYRFTTIESTE